MIPLLVVGCAEQPGPVARPAFVGEPVLVAPEDHPLARVLEVRTDVPTQVTITIDDGVHRTEVAFPDLAREHVLPVLGMGPDRDVSVQVLVRDARGRENERPLPPFRTDPLPVDFPVIDVLALDPDRVEPGWRLLPLEADNGEIWLAALRADDGTVGWLYTGELNWGDVRLTEQGTLIGLFGGGWETDLVGNVLGRWSAKDEDAVPLPWTITHEIHPLPDGSFASLAFAPYDSPSYPISYDDPTPMRPAEIQQEKVVWFDRDGAVRMELQLAELLDPSRIGFGSLEAASLGYDWSHANAILPTGDGGWLVSVRHQDAIVALDPEGDLRWIFGDPGGWSDRHLPHLLAPEPGTLWPYHAHGPSFDGDGNLVVFDNHNYGHTPYGPAPDEPIESRIAAFAIDEERGTVRQLWEWRAEELLYSPALGNATWLPRTGNVVAGYNFLDGEDGVLNADLGRGRKSMRLVEIHPGEAQPISDLRLWTPIDQSPDGIRAYRVVPAPTLYAADVAVSEG